MNGNAYDEAHAVGQKPSECQANTLANSRPLSRAEPCQLSKDG